MLTCVIVAVAVSVDWVDQKIQPLDPVDAVAVEYPKSLQLLCSVVKFWIE
jgi:hypothetical protein